MPTLDEINEALKPKYKAKLSEDGKNIQFLPIDESCNIACYFNEQMNIHEYKERVIIPVIVALNNHIKT